MQKNRHRTAVMVTVGAAAAALVLAGCNSTPSGGSHHSHTKSRKSHAAGTATGHPYAALAASAGPIAVSGS